MEIDRVIGRLEEKVGATADRVERIEKMVESLLVFKWKIYGVTGVIAIIFSGLFQFFIAKISSH